MTSIEKCSVCGGAVVEKKVEKVVKSGHLSKLLKVQAGVCRRCGERFYAPGDAKRFQEARAELASNATMGVRNTSLLTKLEYELWFLDFLEKRYDMIQTQDDPHVIEMTSGMSPTRIDLSSEEHLSSLYNTPVMNAISPLTFLASFKALDMTFEWILEENSLKVPRRFLEKMNLLNKASDLPSLFRNRPDLYRYTKALFSQLVPYRNEVVHRNCFAVSGDNLTLSNSRQGTTLTLNSKETNSLVRFARMLIHALAGKIVVDDCKYKMFCYDLNVLQPVHGLTAFVQEDLLFVHVKFNVPKQGTAFPADLRQVRDTLARNFPTQEVVFDLEVRAKDGENLIAQWYFPPEEVPDLDVMALYEESHKTHRKALVR